MVRKGLAASVVMLAMAGCTPTDNQMYGSAGGAALGAGIGRAVAATATQGTWVGALGGAVVGYAAGTSVDMAAEEKHARATISVAEDGKAASWSTDRGNRGTVIATGEQYVDRSGRPCRPLKQEATLGDRQVSREVTACQAEDSTWIVTEYRPEQRD